MSTRFRTIWLAMAAAATVAGCADPTVGTGAITLSPSAEQAFDAYLAKAAPRYFAVSLDGQAYYYSYCDVGRCLRQAKTQVVRKCETYSEGVPCKIYGSQGNVVWAKDS